MIPLSRVGKKHIGMNTIENPFLPSVRLTISDLSSVEKQVVKDKTGQSIS